MKKEIRLNKDDSQVMFKSGLYRGACLSETMDSKTTIYWSFINRPYVKK